MSGQSDMHDHNPTPPMDDIPRGYKITDLLVYGLVSDKDIYAKLSRGDLCLTADLSARQGNFEKPNPFPIFQACPVDTVKLQLYVRRMLHHDTCVGTVEDSIRNLLLKASNDVVSRSLDLRKDKAQTPVRVEFALKSVTGSDVGDIVHKASTDAGNLASPQAGVEAITHLEKLPEFVDKISETVDTWGDLLNRVQVFMDVCDKVAEVHPYAKMAWSILSVIPKTIARQVERDKKVKSLVVAMLDVFEFTQMAEPLNRIHSHLKIIRSMTQQVTDCGYFIRHYSEKEGFWERTAKNIFSNADTEISDYLSKFEDLQKAFQLEASREISITVVSILDNLKLQGETLEIHVIDSALERMQYSSSARYNPDKRCAPGTRQKIISDIIDWVNEPGLSSILMVSGVAGCGKSSVVHSVAALFGDQYRLGSSFCFDRSDASDRRLDQLFRTVARDLAYRDVRIKRAVYNVIQRDESVLRSQSPSEQFQKLIIEPMEMVETVGPTLVLIDALDESVGDSRDSVLEILGRGTFPANFRFLLAARPDEDIVDALHQKPHVRLLRLDESDGQSTEHDIRSYMESRLSTSPRLKMTDSLYQSLVTYSEGLFQWAATVCKFILGDGKKRAGMNPMKRLEQVLSFGGSGSKENPLDLLYHQVLDSVLDPEDSDSLGALTIVLGHVVTAIQPLSRAVLTKLFPDDESAFSDVLPFLGSLFSGVSGEDTPIRPLHTSLRDFLLDKNRAGSFYIDIATHHEQFSLALFRVMTTHLRFNLCEMSSSHRRNDQISNDTILARIPPHLRYSCVFWPVHLEGKMSSVILTEIRAFLEFRFLFWIEVLSVLGAMEIAAVSMSTLIKQIGTLDLELTEFALDVQRFLRVFGFPVSQSAPHLYVSALPLSPKDSKIYRKCVPRLIPNGIILKTGGFSHWQNTDFILHGHEDTVTSVAFSPDGRKIVSASRDNTVRLWNAETGSLLCEPLKGHKSWITSVAFSPDASGCKIVFCCQENIRLWNVETGATLVDRDHDSVVHSVALLPDKIVLGSDDTAIWIWSAETGATVGDALRGHESPVYSVAVSQDWRKIVSGSEDTTIRVWDAETGTTTRKLLSGHDGAVMSVAFSHDQSRIISGSSDMTVRVWNLEAEETLGKVLRGHEDHVQSVAISPDGHRIISGSDDRTIRVWDADTGAPIGEPMLGHRFTVMAVAFSPDGGRIVSGSDDSTIRVWSTQTGPVVVDSLQGPKHYIYSVDISRDGRRVVSGYSDKLIRIWDAETGAPIGKPLCGHDKRVNAVSFSRDGLRILSCSDDRTIRLWDTDTGLPIGKPLVGHERFVNSAVFSPEGNRIISGSSDKTIRIWDSETGETIGEPLRGHDSAVNSVAVSTDDGKGRIISGSSDRTIRVWDAETGMPVGEPLRGHEGPINSVAFSRDGLKIVSGSDDQTIRVWDAESGLPLREPLLGHDKKVCSVAFSRRGDQVMSGSDDRTIRIWDAETGHALMDPLRSHLGEVKSVIMSLDGCKMVSGSVDKRIIIWSMDTVSPGEEVFEAAVPVISESTSLNHQPFDPVDFNGSQNGQKHQADAFSADNKGLFGKGVKLQSDGWIVGSNSELLLWIPETLHHFLPLHPIQMTMGDDQPLITFDPSKFYHGTEWKRCVTDAWQSEG